MKRRSDNRRDLYMAVTEHQLAIDDFGYAMQTALPEYIVDHFDHDEEYMTPRMEAAMARYIVACKQLVKLRGK